MNNELNNLLELYQAEKKEIEECIKLCISELEYKMAYFHAKALKKLNRKIQTLKQLINPNGDRIDTLLGFKAMWEGKLLLEKNNPEYINFLQQQIEKIDSNINDLAKYVQVEIDGQEFDDVIFALVENKIQNFHFYLNQNTQLYLDFKKEGSKLLISLPTINKLKEKYHFFKRQKKMLKAMGFKKNKGEKSLMYCYDLGDFKDSIALKMLVSHIIYDGIGYYNLENSTIIKIIC